jgi:asparagine synthetase B (glutamine-hydrolysing)
MVERVLDLSPLGHQPMVAPDGKGVLTYNGEVCNYQDLRRKGAALSTADSFPRRFPGARRPVAAR